MFAGVDWAQVFLPDTSLVEIFVRGTITYFALFALLRYLRREAGTVGLSDLLVLVLIADAAQNAMAANYNSLTDGIFLVFTIIAWSYVLNWLGYQVPVIGRFVHPPPLPLIHNGRLIRANMRREFVTQDELMSHLREQGIEDISAVRRAFIEGDGHISVVTHDRQTHPTDERSAAT